jgi:hypothetical protein
MRNRTAAKPYNTALNRSGAGLEGLRAQLGEVNCVASEKGVVFRHDMLAPLTVGEQALIGQAEVIYSDLPWPAGWPMFHARAGVEPSGSYDDYVGAVEALLGWAGKPWFIVCGKRAAERLAPAAMRPINHRGDKVWLAASGEAGATDSGELVAELARQYRSIYDFSCGYGNALRLFSYFVGSDIDRKCLDYIARELL